MLAKPKKLEKGDKVAIVSLSGGVLGEPFVAHEVKLLEQRLTEDFGLNFEYMENSRKGIDFLKTHPEARVADLKQAFLDDTVKIVWSAIGGDDTFRTLPYLMDDSEFVEIVKTHPKIFMGFSDTTNNHLMFYKLGLSTFYGPALLPDLAELGPEMLPYTKKCIKNLFSSNRGIELKSSKIWYKSRKDFSKSQVGVPLEEVEETRGIELMGASNKVSGELLGGCLDSLYEMLEFTRYNKEQKEIFSKYLIFPGKKEWVGKILFIETSEEQMEPEKYKKAILALEKAGVFEGIVGMLVGKPMDEKYIDEYKEILRPIVEKYGITTAYNMNFGHGVPRMVLPIGQKVEIDPENKKIILPEPMVEE